MSFYEFVRLGITLKCSKEKLAPRSGRKRSMETERKQRVRAVVSLEARHHKCQVVFSLRMYHLPMEGTVYIMLD